MNTKMEYLVVGIVIVLVSGTILYLGATGGGYQNCVHSGFNMTCTRPWWMMVLP